MSSALNCPSYYKIYKLKRTFARFKKLPWRRRASRTINAPGGVAKRHRRRKGMKVNQLVWETNHHLKRVDELKRPVELAFRMAVRVHKRIMQTGHDNFVAKCLSETDAFWFG